MQEAVIRRALYWRAGGFLRLEPETLPDRYTQALLLRLGLLGFLPPFSFYVGDSMSDDQSARLRLVNAPVNEPVSLSQAKAFLRIEHTADDGVITTAIATARHMAEAYLRVVLLPQRWEYRLANPCRAVVNLPLGPATAIVSITLTNELGANTIMNVGHYRLGVDGACLYFTSAPQAEYITVQYDASAYALVADIPAPILQGMLHHIAVLVEARDGSTALPQQSVHCYAPYRRVSL